MKYLVLIRHGKSNWSQPHLQDLQRPLNKRGKTEAKKLGQLFSDLEISPDTILTSPAKRAYSTSKKLAKSLNFQRKKIVKNKLIYSENYKDILKLICSVEDKLNLIFIVGHCPSLLNLGNRLLGSHIDKLPTCGILMVEFKEKSWSDISANKGKLILYL